MTDKQRTCGDCAWFQLPGNENNKICTYKCSIDCDVITYNYDSTDASDCHAFRSHADQALIDECHRLRSLGAAVEWSKIDRLVEIAAGRALEKVNRCEWCEGHGNYGVYVDLHGDRVECPACHGTGYKKGGE